MTIAATAMLLASGVALASGGETYRRAFVSDDGVLRIVTADNREIALQRQPDQVGFDKVAVSSSRTAVGWLALYPNCCTSYPIPRELVIYANGQERRFTGIGLPVWRWIFAAAGHQVAFQQETVHGGIGVHYELRDIATGNLVDEYDPPPDGSGTPPEWVRELDSKQ